MVIDYRSLPLPSFRFLRIATAALLWFNVGRLGDLSGGNNHSPPPSHGWNTEALAESSLETGTPLFKGASLVRADIDRSAKSASQSSFPQAGAIAAGYTAEEVEALKESVRNSRFEDIFEARYRFRPGAVEIQAAIKQAEKVLWDLNIVDTLDESHNDDIRFSVESTGYITTAGNWFIAVVDSPYRYFLGAVGYFAWDLMIFLKHLQEKGEARDAHGRRIAVLRDERGKPYPDLVAEYILHERLENEPPLHHHEIIAMTTQAFGRGIYRWDGDRVYDKPLPEGTEVFVRAGQTPLGRALRLFIEWRFRRRVATILGRKISINYLTPSHQSLFSIQGTASAILKKGGEPSLVIVEGRRKTLIPLRRIVRLFVQPKSDFDTFTLGKISSVDLDKVIRRLRKGNAVILTEQQLRSMRVSARSRVLADALEGLLALRDNEGKRMHLGMRLTEAGVLDVAVSAMTIGAGMAKLDATLMAEEIIFHFPNAVSGPTYVAYDAMPAPSSFSDPIEFVRHITDYILNSLVSFTHVLLTPVDLPALGGAEGFEHSQGVGALLNLMKSAA